MSTSSTLDKASACVVQLIRRLAPLHLNMEGYSSSYHMYISHSGTSRERAHVRYSFDETGAQATGIIFIQSSIDERHNGLPVESCSIARLVNVGEGHQ
jgi:hypothetical protein